MKPVLNEDNFFNSKVIKDLDEFKKVSDVIVANRLKQNLEECRTKSLY